MHKLLERQIRRLLAESAAASPDLRPFLDAVDAAYHQADDDRLQLERSMELVSRELMQRVQRQKEALVQAEQARDEVSQAVSALVATLEATTDGILVVDRHGVFSRMNRRCAEIWDLTGEQLAGRTEVDALQIAARVLLDPESLLAEVRRLAESPASVCAGSLTFENGHVVEYSSSPQFVGGEMAGRVWSFRDVTERRHLEEQFRQAQKMDAVGKLASGVAHDFNNLLTVIRTHSDFLIETLPADDGDGPRSDVEAIVEAARRAADLTRQLLAFSRRQVLQPKRLDARAVVSGVIPMLRRLLGEHIGIGSAMGAEECPVLIDPGQLEQVLLNLAVNARDAMPGGGSLELSASMVTLDQGFEYVRTGLVPAGPYVLIAATDTGIGMNAEVCARVFEPFFTTKPRGKGTGLGLSTVYGIVKQSGGFIFVDSTVGSGTTFRVYLPLAADADATPQSARATATARGGETVLVAEDEASVRDLVRRILERNGYRVFVARHAHEAAELAGAAGDEIHLLLTDLTLPDASGQDLVETIRAARPGLKVLFISGYADERTPSASDDMVLEKPFSSSSLTGAVRAALDRA